MSSSTLRSVTSLLHAGARRLPVSLNHSQESGVGRTEAASGAGSTTGVIAGGSPRERGAGARGSAGGKHWCGVVCCRRALGGDEVLPHQPLDVPESADQWNLAGDALDALVDR